MTTTNITVQEAEYIDSRAGNDKFYRTFAFGSAWVAQYGRNGTLGTFTKITPAASPEAAAEAASRKFAEKVRKGYNTVRSGTVATEIGITAENISILDELAGSLPAGQSVGILTAPVTATDIQTARRPDITPDIAGRLGNLLFEGFPTARAVPADLNPVLPVRPMLASVASAETKTDAMHDLEWLAQYKYDGDRVVIEVTNGEIRVLNRSGQAKVKNVGAAHLEPFTALHSGRWVFDGEVVGRTLVLFDMAAATDGHLTWVAEDCIFSTRYWVLESLAEILGIPKAGIETDGLSAPVVLAPLASGQDKGLFLNNAITDQREGIILRHCYGLYESGRRSVNVIKHKMVKDADVVVTGLHATKQSATLAVHDASGQLIEVGAASTIGKGGVSVGDVWVVTFLYVTDPAHPRLFQPRLVSSRTDKTAAECTIDQFADAGTSKVV